jgi:restriction system protein
MDTERVSEQNPSEPQPANTKFCKHCGKPIAKEAVICPLCGCQVEELHQQPAAQPNIIINNSNANTNTNVNNVGCGPRMRNKWVAFFLCLFLGYLGAHKFYEGKVGMGILYFFTFGLCGIGWVVDLIRLLLKPNPYYV